MDKQPICLLVGFTASGKKTVGVRVAQRMGAEMISLDSIKVYRGMDIGTAKPTGEDRTRAAFHMLDILEPGDSFSVGQFLERAGKIVEEVRGRNRRVLFLGGTAFYLNCILNGLIQGHDGDPTVRRELQKMGEEKGTPYLHSLLTREDPLSAEQIHPHDLKRVVRALEVMRVSGKPLSWLKTHKTVHFITGPFRVAGLRWPMDRLKERIAVRTRRMVDQGLVEEVQAILDRGGFGPESGRAIGYRQIIEHLRGECSLEESLDRIITATWRFAKKQMTWYKRFDEIRWFDVNSENDRDILVEGIHEYFTAGPADIQSCV